MVKGVLSGFECGDIGCMNLSEGVFFRSEIEGWNRKQRLQM